jgi:hypothetical protein
MTTDQPLGSPDPDRGGETVDAAVENAETGSQVEGVHTPSGQAKSGESRVEKMADVSGVREPRVDGEPEGTPPPDPGPGPADLGAGGAQRLAGARISDRISAGEAVPEGPPFAEDSDGNPEDRSGARA